MKKKKVVYQENYVKDSVTHDSESIVAINKCTSNRFLINTGKYDDGTEFCTIKFDGVDTVKLKKLMDALDRKSDPRLPFQSLH